MKHTNSKHSSASSQRGKKVEKCPNYRTKSSSKIDHPHSNSAFSSQTHSQQNFQVEETEVLAEKSPKFFSSSENLFSAGFVRKSQTYCTGKIPNKERKKVPATNQPHCNSAFSSQTPVVQISKMRKEDLPKNVQSFLILKIFPTWDLRENRKLTLQEKP